MAFDPLTAISDLVSKALSFIPNPAEREKAEAEMRASAMTMAQQITLAQLEVNQAEAANSSMFVAGWRPAIGWVCATALAFQVLVRPAVSTAATIAGTAVPELPGIDDSLWQLMLGMLGLGGLRTIEKIRGAARGR